MQAFQQHFKEHVANIKSIVIGSPGFIKDQFFDHLKKEASDK
jgi:stalled ribosome rescue protein Dom34